MQLYLQSGADKTLTMEIKFEGSSICHRTPVSLFQRHLVCICLCLYCLSGTVAYVTYICIVCWHLVFARFLTSLSYSVLDLFDGRIFGLCEEILKLWL